MRGTTIAVLFWVVGSVDRDGQAGKPVGIQRFIGRLARALDEARARGWTVVSVKPHWSVLFPGGR